MDQPGISFTEVGSSYDVFKQLTTSDSVPPHTFCSNTSCREPGPAYRLLYVDL